MSSLYQNRKPKCDNKAWAQLNHKCGLLEHQLEPTKILEGEDTHTRTEI